MGLSKVPREALPNVTSGDQDWSSARPDGAGCCRFDRQTHVAEQEGRDYRTHIDPVGERLTERELRTLEETYLLHKLAVVVGERHLLVVTELAQCFKFRGGKSA